MRVRDPWGGRWRVSRRWHLWRPQGMELMRGTEVPADMSEEKLDRGSGHPMIRGNSGFAAEGIPVAAVERVLLWLLLPVSALAHALGLPWTVQARRESRRYYETRVRGWAASAAAVAELAHEIEQGRAPERNVGAAAPDESRRPR